jgi:hypothetical protein
MAQQYGPLTIRADGLDGKKAFQYEATVLGMLRSLEQMQVGRALMQAFRFYRREVLIYPYDRGAVGAERDCNAYVYETWGMFRTKLSFSPMDFLGKSTCFSEHGVDATPHEVLFHELVHAMRASAGKRLKFEGRSGEERIAVMVTNIFSSEINRPLRLPGGGTDHMEMFDAKFASIASRMIEVFYQQHPEFFRWVAECKVPFNPLRIHYQTLKGVPRLRTA